MKKKGFTLVDFLIVMAILGILATIVIPQWSKNGQKPESGKSQEVPAYRITTLWEDKESGRAEFYVEGLIRDPNMGYYVSYLSQAKRKIEADGYDVKIVPALYTRVFNNLQDIWVIAERRK